MTVYLILGGMVGVSVLINIIQGKRNKSQRIMMEDKDHTIRALNDRLIKMAKLNKEKKDADMQNQAIQNANSIDIDKYADGLQDVPKRRRTSKVSNG